MKVYFHASYDHRWPSRAVTHYPAGFRGTVKREVAEAAIAKGKATAVSKRDKPATDAEDSDLGRSRGVAQHDYVDYVGTEFRDPIVDGSGE